MTGMTIPGVDILGSKKGYNPDRPWLFEDFDQITYYRVTEEEYEKELALFNSGRYEYQWEEVVFDMAEHNKLFRDTKDEVASIRSKQREAQAEMDKLEAELLDRWAKEKAERGIPMDTIETLLQGMLFHLTSNLSNKKTKILTNATRSRNHPHRSAPQRQRLESRNKPRRQDRTRPSRGYPRGHEARDCRPG